MNKIEDLRKEKNLSQKELAEKLQISQSAVSEWEKQLRLPKIEHLINMSNIFGYSIDYILGRENDYGFIEVNNQLTKEEEHILKMIQKLDTKQKGKAEGYISAMIEENKYKTIKEG